MPVSMVFQTGLQKNVTAHSQLTVFLLQKHHSLQIWNTMYAAVAYNKQSKQNTKTLFFGQVYV